MVRRIVLCLMVTVAFAAATGCASTARDTEQVITAYLDASLHDRDEEAYSYLSQRYRSAMSLEDYTGAKENSIVIQSDEFVKRTTFDVKNVDVKGDRAKAEVEITEPDLKMILKDLVDAFVEWILDDKDGLNKFEDEMGKKYSRGDIPMITRLQYYDLVREDGTWKVDLEP
jgi:hypothetical protein